MRPSGVAGHQPAGGDEPDLGAVDVRIEGRPHRVGDPVPGRVIRVGKGATQRAEPGDVAEQLALGHRAHDVDRLEGDATPAALLQHGADTVGISEGELARRAWLPRRESTRAARQPARPWS